jgi:phosphoribosylanthranilate isomerase
MRTRVKICGLTRIEDGLVAARAGADAIGLVFADSPRRVTAGQARAIAAAMPPFVTVVGLFVDADPAAVRAALGSVRIDLLQFHGSESPEYCRQFSKPYIKAVPMREGVDVSAQAMLYADAAGLLLDTHSAGVAGGSGRAFDWARVPTGLSRPVILAGGLNPDNVAEAVRRVRPYAVDVSSGVEREKGIKDEARVQAFIHAVQAAS